MNYVFCSLNQCLLYPLYVIVTKSCMSLGQPIISHVESALEAQMQCRYICSEMYSSAAPFSPSSNIHHPTHIVLLQIIRRSHHHHRAKINRCPAHPVRGKIHLGRPVSVGQKYTSAARSRPAGNTPSAAGGPPVSNQLSARGPPVTIGRTLLYYVRSSCG